MKAQRAPRTVARVFAIFPDDSAVDHDLFDTLCGTNRVVKSRAVGDCIRIKKYQVGKVSWLKDSPVLETKTGGREGGHFTHCLFQTEQLDIPDIVSQDTWESSPEPGMWVRV